MAFNLAFIGMFLYHLIFIPEFDGPPPRKDIRRMRNMIRHLPKNKEFHDNIKNLIRKRRRKREEFIEMLSKKNVSKDVLTEKLNEVIYLENKISKLTGKYMIKSRCQMDRNEIQKQQKRNRQRRQNEKD